MIKDFITKVNRPLNDVQHEPIDKSKFLEQKETSTTLQNASMSYQTDDQLLEERLRLCRNVTRLVFFQGEGN